MDATSVLYNSRVAPMFAASASGAANNELELN